MRRTPSDDAAPLCECGCGEPVRDRRNGVWARWRPGHSRRRTAASTDAGDTPALFGVGTGSTRSEAPPASTGSAPLHCDGQLAFFDDDEYLAPAPPRRWHRA